MSTGYSDALWGSQVWIDHGDGIESRYGGFASLLPTLQEGQSVHRLAILGYAGEGPVYLGIWVDGQYLGKFRSIQETASVYRAILIPD